MLASAADRPQRWAILPTTGRLLRVAISPAPQKPSRLWAIWPHPHIPLVSGPLDRRRTVCLGAEPLQDQRKGVEPADSRGQLRKRVRRLSVGRPRKTVSVILTTLSRHEQVVVDRTSATTGDDVEKPLRSINDEMYCSVLPGEHPPRAKRAPVAV